MATIEKAGAIILSQQDPSKVLLFRAREQDYSFPKGHVEEGEYWLDTMDREVEEETGLMVEVITEGLPTMEYDMPGGDHSVVNFALARSLDDSALKTEFEGDSLSWVAYDQVAEKLTHDNLRDYYGKIFPEVEQAIKEQE